MKATDDLHRLLHSLSQAEKRYVKVFASKHLIGDQSNALLLFDAILSLKEYDEDELKRQLKGQSVARYLSSEKTNLYRFVLKSMRMFHAEKSVDRQLKELMTDVRFLFDKRLYDLSIKELDKAKKLAIEFERHLVLLEILFLERIIIFETETKDVKPRVEQIHRDIGQTLEQIRRFSDLAHFSDLVFVASRSRFHVRDGQILSKLHDLSKEKLFSSPPPDDNFSLYYQYLFVRGMYHLNAGEYDQAYWFYQKQVEHWDSYPAFINEERQRYKKSLTNYLNCCLGLGRFEEFPHILGRIRAVPCASIDEEAEEFQSVYYMELIYCMNINRFELAEALLPEIQKGLKKYEGKVSKARELAFYHNIAVMLFLQHKHKEALAWVKRILNDGKSDSRQDIQHFARLFQLVLDYEIGSTVLFEHELRTTQRYLRQNNSYFDFEAVVMQYLRRLADADKSEKKELFNTFLDKLNVIKTDPTHRKTLGIEELVCWADSHVRGVPMTELLKGA